MTPATSKRILMAEDNPHDVELILMALAEHRLADDVMVVRDGVEALDYLSLCNRPAGPANGLPAVILLDLKMPRLDGMEALRAIKADPDLKAIPVVMLTSSREEVDLVRSYALGVNAYVVKPVDFRQFVEAVKQLGLFWSLHNEPPPGSIRQSI